MKESKLAIEYQQRRLLLPAVALPALQMMQAQRTFTAGDLPSGLDLEARLALVRNLIEREFLVVA